MDWIRIKEYGLIKDTPQNRILKKTKIIIPCEDCQKLVTLNRQTSILDNHSLMVSGNAPPIGMIQRIDYYNSPLCIKCQEKQEKQMREENEQNFD